MDEDGERKSWLTALQKLRSDLCFKTFSQKGPGDLLAFFSPFSARE
jgi:hypothetical protein